MKPVSPDEKKLSRAISIRCIKNGFIVLGVESCIDCAVVHVENLIGPPLLVQFKDKANHLHLLKIRLGRGNEAPSDCSVQSGGESGSGW